MLAASLQPVRAQTTGSGLFRVEAGNPPSHDWMSRNLRRGIEGWPRVWQRALDMGESLAPFLASELGKEKDWERRLVVIGAYSVAARRPHDVVLHRRVFASERVRVRAMALIALALGPRQPGECRELQRFLDSSRLSPLEQVATCLALARFDRTPVLPKSVLSKARDPGVLAAALYCRPDRTRTWIEKSIRPDSESQFTHLVWRGYLLGTIDRGIADKDRLALAIDTLQSSSSADDRLLQAAAFYLAHAKEPVALKDRDVSSQPKAIQLLLCHAPNVRSKILSAAPSPPRMTVDELVPRRWFVLYSRWAPIDSLAQAVKGWRTASICRDPKMRRAISLAIAWRLSRLDESAAARAAQRIDWFGEGDVPASMWIRVAGGETTTGETHNPTDPHLARAYPLAVNGQLARSAMADVLEAALWRDGSHPGHAGLDLHRQFLGELFIDGSRRANTKFAKGRPYRASGLGRENEFFRVAYEFYKFIRQTEPWTLREYRLRN